MMLLAPEVVQAMQRLERAAQTPLLVAADEQIGVLFFPGDPKRHKETTDVAVVLPELIAAFGDRVRPAVVSREAEIELQKHYGFRAWPSLVFVRRGGYLGTVSRMKNWSEYLQEIQTETGVGTIGTETLHGLGVGEPREAPGFRVLKQGPDQESAKQEGTAK